MQNDEVIWQIIRHNHCSYMSKITTGIFCRNPYNVTGICNRSSCPLANSRYATIREIDGIFYLYMKSIERAHMPNKLWERVKLPRNYEKALEIIDKHMMHWPKFLVHKIKQRLTKMTQCRIRMKKLELKVREKIMTVPRKEKKREARREEKAEKAAVLDKSIERELLERLKKGVYGDIYNYPFKKYEELLGRDDLQVAEGKDEQQEVEIDEDEDMEEEPEIEYVEGYDELEEEEEDELDIEDFGKFEMPYATTSGNEDPSKMKTKMGRSVSDLSEHDIDAPDTKRKRKARVLVEVEHEGSGERQKAIQ